LKEWRKSVEENLDREEVKDFSLPDQNKDEFRLQSYRGKRVLLSYHPLAWTTVCSKQMSSLEDCWDEFVKLNTVAVGISVDTVPSKKAWAKSLGIQRTRLLSDFWPHGEVSRSHGVFREKEGVSERANIIVDERGRLAFSKIYPMKELPDIEEILIFLREMR
jgi:peroxiredoxin